MTIKPLSDRVVVKMVEVEETTKSGLILTAASKEKPQFAEVISVGPGAYDKNGVLVPIKDISVGDRVIISNYAGNKVKVDSEEYIIVNVSDILAVVA
ncbi:MAG: co-chaperone GroES [Eubacteriales bacterium]